jgi:hypothetical protein
MMKKLLISVIILSAVVSASAQKVNKKPLDHSVFDGWQSVTGQFISNDGKWVLYTVKPQAADADLVITDAANTAENKHPRAQIQQDLRRLQIRGIADQALFTKRSAS